MGKIKSQASAGAGTAVKEEVKLDTPVITQKQKEVLQKALQLGYQQIAPYEESTVTGIQFNKAYSTERRNAGKAWVEELNLYITNEIQRRADAAIKETTRMELPKSAAEKNWKKWSPEDCLANMDVAESSEEYTREMLLAYIAYHMPSLKSDAKNAGGVEPWDYVAGSMSNSINDGDVEWEPFKASEVPNTEDKPDGQQEIIEISKERVKEALRVLLSTKNTYIAMLYEKHAQYNSEFFEGALSTPVITIDKMDNRTLANYTYEGDPMAVDQHIKFNINFIALNEDWRILETLRHEMIHQWQDEVAYGKRDATDNELKMTKLPKIDVETKAIVFEDVLQRRRPKETHNNDFRLYAAIVGIPAEGPNCTGNPANMPEPQSYNRKFVCLCMASNKYRMTIYSTREVDATCNVCGTKYTEVSKATEGKTITAKVSHIEKPGQDAIQDEMGAKYTEFVRFESKTLKDGFVDEIMGGTLAEGAATAMEQGVYQKGHNAYAWGHRYWVAYSMPDGTTHKKGKAGASKPKKTPVTPVTPKVEQAPIVETPPTKPVEVQQEPPATHEEPKVEVVVTPPPARKGRGSKVVQFPTGEAQQPPAPADDGFDPQAVLDAYDAAGSIRKTADALGIPYTSLTRKITKYSIDFNAKTFKMPE